MHCRVEGDARLASNRMGELVDNRDLQAFNQQQETRKPHDFSSIINHQSPVVRVTRHMSAVCRSPQSPMPRRSDFRRVKGGPSFNDVPATRILEFDLLTSPITRHSFHSLPTGLIDSSPLCALQSLPRFNYNNTQGAERSSRPQETCPAVGTRTATSLIRRGDAYGIYHATRSSMGDDEDEGNS